MIVLTDKPVARELGAPGLPVRVFYCHPKRPEDWAGFMERDIVACISESTAAEPHVLPILRGLDARICVETR